MSVTISVVRAWDLDTVGAQINHLRRDDNAFDTASAVVRNSYQEQLDGLDGHTVSASTHRCRDISRDLGILSGKTERLHALLHAFHSEALIYLPKLLHAIDSVPAEFSVGDDGTVRPPALIGDPSDPTLKDALERNSETASTIQEEIQRLLRELERCDLEAANALNLMSMTESYTHYPYEPATFDVNPRTIAAATTIDASTGILSETARYLDGASTATRLLPGVGTVLNLATGVATSPEDESIAETLFAELAGVTSAAAAGATAGSIIPGYGTVAGLAAGILLGPGVTNGVRNQLARQRADGKEGFSW